MSGAGHPPGLDLDRLAPYFRRHVPGCEGPLRATLLAGGRSNLTYCVGDGAREWVLRRPPLGLVAPTANDVGREFRFLAALRRSAVPVPEAIALCEDAAVIGAPFSVVSKVEGDVLRSAVQTSVLGRDVAERCANALVEALAALHDVSHAGLGLPGTAKGFLGRQLARWRAQWEVVRTRESPALGRLHRALARGLPHSAHAAVVHGDYRIDNVIFAPGDPGTIAAVIDWEMAAVGDPLADLGLLLVYWDPVCEPVLGQAHPVGANSGFPTRDELASAYAARRACELDDLEWYVGLACLKLAVIAAGIHRRFVDGDTIGDGFDRIGDAIEPLLAMGLDAVEVHARGR